MDEIDPNYVEAFDPAQLLPYEVRFEPDGTTAVKLPKAYRGSLEKEFLAVPNRSGKM